MYMKADEPPQHNFTTAFGNTVWQQHVTLLAFFQNPHSVKVREGSREAKRVKNLGFKHAFREGSVKVSVKDFCSVGANLVTL